MKEVILLIIVEAALLCVGIFIGYQLKSTSMKLESINNEPEFKKPIIDFKIGRPLWVFLKEAEARKFSKSRFQPTREILEYIEKCTKKKPSLDG